MHMKLLFVGNSHTYVNDLPAMFMQLCQAAGENVYTHSVTKGGWRLRQYADWKMNLASSSARSFQSSTGI